MNLFIDPEALMPVWRLSAGDPVFIDFATPLPPRSVGIGVLARAPEAQPEDINQVASAFGSAWRPFIPSVTLRLIWDAHSGGHDPARCTYVIDGYTADGDRVMRYVLEGADMGRLAYDGHRLAGHLKVHGVARILTDPKVATS